MGVPSGGGTNLGTATGRIVINTDSVRAAQQQVEQASRAMSTALGAIGIAGGVAGVAQVVRFGVEVTKLATAYERQEVAALSLAGSQEKLNSLLAAYQSATGGAVDNAQALADVTRLQAIGFADSAAELDNFARAARGISIATGQSQDYIISQLQLAIANQSTMRLDQLGLGVQEVKQRIDELKTANSSLTTEMAYQQAVLGLAEDKVGDLTKSAAGQASEVEKLEIAWKNLRLELGRTVERPANSVAGVLAKVVDALASEVGRAERVMAEYEANWGIGVSPPWLASIQAAQRTDRSEANPEVDRAIADWHRGTLEIERQAANDRLQATRQFEQQRTSTIRQYEQTIAREAEDFARSRLRSEQDYAISLSRMHRDIAQREARQLADLERTISDARTDAAERASDRQIALDERIAETRAQSNERIAEMEADFARRRVRAQRDHADRLRDAAANLDAVAVREAQRDFRNRQRDAQEDFNERIGKERANEAKRLEELNKAHAKQTADEAKALQRRIDQANAAYRRQLEDARAADAQRIEDMAADFALRQQRENEDRATRLERLAEDHQAQLEEQVRAHEERMIQIADHEREELKEHNRAFDEQMASLNKYHAGYKEKEDAHYARSLAAYQQYLNAQEAELARRTAVQGPLASPWAGPVFGGGVPTVVPSSVNNSRAVSITAPIQVFAATGQSPHDIAGAVRREIADLLEEIAN